MPDIISRITKFELEIRLWSLLRKLEAEAAKRETAAKAKGTCVSASAES